MRGAPQPARPYQTLQHVARTRDAHGPQVPEQQVTVAAARGQRVAVRDKGCRERAGVGDHLPRILGKGGRGHLLQLRCDRSDLVLVRAALQQQQQQQQQQGREGRGMRGSSSICSSPPPSPPIIRRTWSAGKTALLIFCGKPRASGTGGGGVAPSLQQAAAGRLLRLPLRKKIMPARGPRSDLCVVVVTTSHTSKGLAMRPAAATSPEMT